MSSSKTSNISFWILSAVAVILFALLILGSFGAQASLRHSLTSNLENRGETSTGTTQVSWFELAHVVSPRDPAIGLKLASAQADQGSAVAALHTLSDYPSYLPAALLRSQLLIAQNQANQAQAALDPFRLQSPEADYILAQSMAEQGELGSAVVLLQASAQRFGQGDKNGLLQDYLQMAVGQSPTASVTSPEAAGALKNAIGNKTAVALALYRLGLLNASQYVLSGITPQTTVSYLLQAQIALNRINPSKSEAEQDYLQALTLDPTDVAVGSQALDLAKQLHNSAAISRIQQIQGASAPE